MEIAAFMPKSDLANRHREMHGSALSHRADTETQAQSGLPHRVFSGDPSRALHRSWPDCPTTEPSSRAPIMGTIGRLRCRSQPRATCAMLRPISSDKQSAEMRPAPHNQLPSRSIALSMFFCEISSRDIVQAQNRSATGKRIAPT
jgi:hypothetical protein